MLWSEDLHTVIWFRNLEQALKTDFRQKVQGQDLPDTGLISPFHQSYCCSVAKSCPTLCSPMDSSMPGFSLLHYLLVAVVQLLSCIWLFATPWTAVCQAFLSFTISRSLLKLMSIELVMSFNHLIFCHPLLLLPSVFPSIRVFSKDVTLCIRWPKYWSLSYSIKLPMNIQNWFILWLNCLISLQSKGLSKIFSNTTVQKHQFFGAQPSLLSNSHIHTRLL